MDARIEASLAERRFSMLLLTTFALVALALAAIGTYGVMAYAVSQSTRELGIRIALGATPRGIVSLVVRQGLLLALAGVGTGLAGALALSRVTRGLLFGVTGWDPLTYAAIGGLLALVTVAACVAPARRASRTDPLVSLRGD